MPVDAISLEVFKNLFASVAEEMGETLRRAALSPNIRERLDFSCAIFDSQARMVAQAAHIPVHLGSMPASVEYAILAFEEFHAGDVIVLNNPYRGGTHLPDVTMVSPVFAGGELVYFVASRAHHADIGGMSPGSLPLSTDIYQEGLIIPPVKLKYGGWISEGVLEIIITNSRNPDERQGDIEAQLAAHRIGENRLLNMMVDHGVDVVNEHAAALLDYSQRMTEATIQNIPNGMYTFRDIMESDGQNEQEIPIVATVAVENSHMTVDFSESAPQVSGNINAVESIARSATWYAVRLLAEDDIPVNHGCFAPVTIITRPGSVLNPHFPAATAAGNVETSQRIVDVVLGALAQALPDKIPAASQGTMNNVTIGGITHSQANTAQSFVYYETIGGGHGAGPLGNGIGGRHSHMTNTLNTPVESIEYTFPLRVLEYGLRDESGGKGKYQGGDGVRRTYQFLSPATVTVNSERRINTPYGLHGGKSGQPGVNQIEQDGETRKLGGKHSIQVKAGDKLIIKTPGGGGWG